MASAEEVWEGRQATSSWPDKRVYTRVFDVTTDSPFDDAATAAAVVGISKGDPHPTDDVAVCVSINPSQKADSPTLWQVSYGYDSHPEIPEVLQPDATGGVSPPEPVTPAEAAAAGENPQSKQPVWKVSFQQTQEPAVKDRNLDPVWNSARLPFDPPIMVEVSRPIVTVTFNKPSFGLDHAEYIQDAVNSETWRGMEPRTCRLIGVEAQSMQENGVAFWSVSYTLAIKRDTWDYRPLDCGFAEWDLGSPGLGIPARWVKIVDDYGKEPTEPVPLNGSGRKLTPGDAPVYLRFRIYREISFAENLG
ncbi:MAG TPA: hypothetical protein VD866_20865 [Urbifossiella sp.]|nr:hypothetical protein [Urbifossiella sp.]